MPDKTLRTYLELLTLLETCASVFGYVPFMGWQAFKDQSGDFMANVVAFVKETYVEDSILAPNKPFLFGGIYEDLRLDTLTTCANALEGAYMNDPTRLKRAYLEAKSLKEFCRICDGK